MKSRKKKSLPPPPDERRRGVAAILALAVRRVLRVRQNSKILSPDASNRVDLVLEKRLSVSLGPGGSGLSNQ